MSTDNDLSLSTLSLNSPSSLNEDWDRSLSESDILVHIADKSTTTPRNSVIFPSEDTQATPGKTLSGSAKRSLSELLRVHAQKGTDCKFSAEEALRVADVLGQWINSGPSPYEAEDDFFARSHDDLSIPTKRFTAHETNSRPRGRSESKIPSRPPSSASITT